VLGNLVNNALRYTPEGGEIRLSASREGGKLRIDIADNGAGILAQDLPYIFERSYRGDRSRVQSDGEAGLGLAIARSIVEAMGGKIGVQSEQGKGTTFSIWLAREGNS
jgi:signal transduction histidine kinase